MCKELSSIRNKQELSFLAKGPSSELVTEVADGVFLYKLGVLYGANASGKSNMLIALNEVFRLLVLPKSDATQRIKWQYSFHSHKRTILLKCMCHSMLMASDMIMMYRLMRNSF